MNFTIACSWPGGIVYEGAMPCGPLNSSSPVIPCCAAGDLCLTDNICTYTHALPGGSGYYTAGCSNGGFSNSSDAAVCSDRCGDIHFPDIVYDADSETWRCCGVDDNSTRTCQNPTDESFRGAAPSALMTYWSAGATTATATTQPTAAATATDSPPRAATTSSAADETSSGLSTGAKAGIGVGVAVGAIIVLAMGIIFFLRGRRKSEQQPAREEMPMVPGESKPLAGNSYVHPSELPGDQNVQNIQELPGQSTWGRK